MHEANFEIEFQSKVCFFFVPLYCLMPINHALGARISLCVNLQAKTNLNWSRFHFLVSLAPKKKKKNGIINVYAKTMKTKRAGNQINFEI